MNTAIDHRPEAPERSAAPCVACMTTAGPLSPGSDRPRRIRGHCQRCYQRLRSHGDLLDYANFLRRANEQLVILESAFLFKPSVATRVLVRQTRRALRYRPRGVTP